MIKKTKEKIQKYCCERFAIYVEDGSIRHSTSFDETEWFIGDLAHLYFCPFCGQYIKGEGFGTYDEEIKKKKKT